MKRAGNAADSDALIVVYGSLKRGMSNHQQLQGARWLGTTRLKGLALYDLGPFPMATPCNEPGCGIDGELYSVSAALLEQLDRFEGAPRLYQRQRWPLNNGEAAWVYVGRARQVRYSPRIRSGHWPGSSPNRRPKTKQTNQDSARTTTDQATNQRPATAVTKATADAANQARREVAS